MSTQRKPTVPQLLRKIARLEQQIVLLKTDNARTARLYGEYMCKTVDLDFRIAHAVAVLKGETE